jgi:hypothetical protein
MTRTVQIPQFEELKFYRWEMGDRRWEIGDWGD